MKQIKSVLKVLVVLFVAAMLPLVMAGCGKDDKKPAEEHPTATDHPADEHPAGEHPSGEHPK